MEVTIFRREECAVAKGLCVVIDVLRAFTTAAFAFDAGAEEIILVSTPEEALQKYRQDNSLLLMGEVHGMPVEGFHFSNSPAEFENISIKGRRLVQRTSAGTQGVVNCRLADRMLLSSFVVAEATLKRIQALSPKQVSFIVTGTQNGDEDLALAEYLLARLQGEKTALNPFLERVRHSPEGKVFADPALPEFLERDLELALQADRFSFAMEIEREGGDLIAKPTYL